MILEQLNGYGSQTITSKAFGNQDLAALSAATGDEFAMFTTGGRRLIIRGNATSVPINVAKEQDLSAKIGDGLHMYILMVQLCLHLVTELCWTQWVGNEALYLTLKIKEESSHLMVIVLRVGHHDYARKKEAPSCL